MLHLMPRDALEYRKPNWAGPPDNVVPAYLSGLEQVRSLGYAAIALTGIADGTILKQATDRVAALWQDNPPEWKHQG